MADPVAPLSDALTPLGTEAWALVELALQVQGAGPGRDWLMAAFVRDVERMPATELTTALAALWHVRKGLPTLERKARILEQDNRAMVKRMTRREYTEALRESLEQDRVLGAAAANSVAQIVAPEGFYLHQGIGWDETARQPIYDSEIEKGASVENLKEIREASDRLLTAIQALEDAQERLEYAEGRVQDAQARIGELEAEVGRKEEHVATLRQQLSAVLGEPSCSCGAS